MKKNNKNKYKLDKKIFIPIFIIILTSIIIINQQEKLITIKNYHIILTPTETLHCEGKNGDKCEFTLPNKTKIILNAGQTQIINQHTNKYIPIINYGTWTLIITGILINHYLHNNKKKQN